MILTRTVGIKNHIKNNKKKYIYLLILRKYYTILLMHRI
jgi:hypothetical protein